VGVSNRRLVDAFKKARECDPVSAYGGVIGFNRPVTSETAREVANTFFEAIIAPSYDKEARKILSAKKEPPRAGHGRRVPVVGRPDLRDEARERRAAPADGRPAHARPGDLKVVTKRKAHYGRGRGDAVRVEGVQACEIERDRLRG